MRELLINAVAHRDYSISGSDIKLAIYDDMLEITSPGVLMIDKAQLGKGYSELRNPHLGLLLKKLSIIEQWGTGYSKIESDLENHPDLELKINDDGNFVQVRLVKVNYALPTQKSTQKPDGVISTKEKILILLKDNPYLTRAELANDIGVSDSAIK